jgi:type VI secretion system protein ImpH
VSELLFARYGAFNVFQLLRLLQWRDRTRAQRAAQPAAPERQLRFRADLSAAFPGREISAIKRTTPRVDTLGEPPYQRQPGHEVVEISTPNYCVASALGPLPEPYVEWMRDLQRLRHHAMRDFIDLFNQRIHALRYDLKASLTPGLNHAPPQDTRQAYYLACLMGLGQPELAAQVPLGERVWLGLAGLLANQRRSVAALRQVLALYLGAPVEIEQQAGAWQPIEDDDRIALGRANHALGAGAVLGQRVWDQQARIRVVAGPLPFERFARLLPPAPNAAPGAGFARFAALLRLLLDRLCDCEVRLHVQPDSVPAAVLTAQPGAQPGLRLGQTAWLQPDRRAADRSTSATFMVRAFAAMNDDREAA